MRGKVWSMKDAYNHYVIRKKGCWDWSGYKYKGYGNFRASYKAYRAHRASWIIHFGEIPEGLCVCHKCDNPPCTNPDHLFLGTKSENSLDMIEKGRSITAGKFGSKNHMSKLTDQQREDIIVLYDKGSTNKQLAKMFNVSYGTICYTRFGKKKSEVA